MAVVANHATDWPFGGGADTLMILVGYNLARFQFGRFVDGRFWEVILRQASKVVLPYYGLLALYHFAVRPVERSSWLLASNFEGRFGNALEPFWFIEAFLQCLVIMLLISFVPGAKQLAKRFPLRFGLVILTLSVVIKALSTQFADHGALLSRTPDEVFIFIAFGWCLFFAKQPFAKILLLLAALVFFLAATGIVSESWWHSIGTGFRGTWVLATAAMLLYFNRFPIPSFVRTCAVIISTASFTIYLFHIFAIQVTVTRLNNSTQLMAFLAGLLSGIIIHYILAKVLLIINKALA